MLQMDLVRCQISTGVKWTNVITSLLVFSIPTVSPCGPLKPGMLPLPTTASPVPSTELGRWVGVLGCDPINHRHIWLKGPHGDNTRNCPWLRFPPVAAQGLRDRASFSFPQEHFKNEFTSGDGKKGKSFVLWDWKVYSWQWLTDGSPDWYSSSRLRAFLWIQLRGRSWRQPHPGPLQNPGRITGGRNGPQPQQTTQWQMEL